MFKAWIIVTLAVLALADYPLYTQCDDRWGSQQMGSSFYSICDAGSMLCSLAMASTKDYNPSTLNKWLKDNAKYRGYLITLTSLDQIGLSYQTKIANSNIKVNLDAGNVVIGELVYGNVLIEGYEGDVLFVKNPVRGGKSSYPISEFIDGVTVVFKRIQSNKQI